MSFSGVVVDPDYSLYPDKEFQMKWLRIYVSEKAKIQGAIDYAMSVIIDSEICVCSLNKYFFRTVTFVRFCLFC